MPGTSSVARLQRAVVLGLAAAALACWWALHEHSPGWALAAAAAVASIHAWVLGLEFILMRSANRHDALACAAPAPTFAAWLREVVHATRIFGWRQPFAWRKVGDWPESGSAGARGIVFVHGYLCNRGFWSPWMREARRRGHPYIAVNLEPVFGSIDEYAPIIDAAVARMVASTGRAPVLVCHSMGGLAARAWRRACGQPSRVARIVTIGSPHGGTWLARFSHVANGRQMRSGSEWLRQLAADEAGDYGCFTCWHADADNIVFPLSTATLPGADNRLVPGAAHVDLAFQPRVIQDTFALVAAR